MPSFTYVFHFLYVFDKRFFETKKAWAPWEGKRRALPLRSPNGPPSPRSSELKRSSQNSKGRSSSKTPSESFLRPLEILFFKEKKCFENTCFFIGKSVPEGRQRL